MAAEKTTKAKAVKTEKAQTAKAKKDISKNPMRKIFIEKVILSAGGKADNLTKAKKLIELVSGKQAEIIVSQKRIPAFDVRPGLEVGTRVTVRDAEALALLRRILGAVDNKLKASSAADNHISFGIKEYIEIPGMEYQRDIGIRGFNITVVFARAGLRVARKKIKQGHIPHRQHVSKQDVMNYMKEEFKSEFI